MKQISENNQVKDQDKQTPKVCAYFQRNKCNNGDKCKFLHEKKQKSTVIDQPQNKNEQKNDKDKQKSQKEQNQNQKTQKIVEKPKIVCQFFLKNLCKNNDKCKFVHSTNEQLEQLEKQEKQKQLQNQQETNEKENQKQSKKQEKKQKLKQEKEKLKQVQQNQQNNKLQEGNQENQQKNVVDKVDKQNTTNDEGQNISEKNKKKQKKQEKKVNQQNQNKQVDKEEQKEKQTEQKNQDQIQQVPQVTKAISKRQLKKLKKLQNQQNQEQENIQKKVIQNQEKPEVLPKIQNPQNLEKNDIQQKIQNQDNDKNMQIEDQKQTQQQQNQKQVQIQKQVQVQEQVQEQVQDQKQVQVQKQEQDQNIINDNNIKKKGKESSDFQYVMMNLFSFSKKFMNFSKNQQRGAWDIQKVRKDVQEFLDSLCGEKGKKLICFIDGIKKTKQDLKNWKNKKESQVLNGDGHFIVTTGEILGEIFREQGAKYGVKVYNCLEDVKDTIANWAYHQNGAVLSFDNNCDFDFFGYYSNKNRKNFYDAKKQKPFLIFKDYNHKTGKFQQYTGLSLKDCEEYDYYVEIESANGKIDYAKQKIIKLKQVEVTETPLLALQAKNLTEKHNKITFDEGSGAIKLYGNPCIKFQEMRAALYHHLGVDLEVEEEYLEWDKKQKKVQWETQMVKPKENKNLLQNPTDFIEKNLEPYPEKCDEKLKLIIDRHNVNVKIQGLLLHSYFQNKPLIQNDYVNNFNI